MKKKTELAVVNEQVISKASMFDAIDNVILDLHKNGDVDKALHVVDVLDDFDSVSGLAKAKLLYWVRDWWDLNNQTEVHQMEFEDYVDQSSKKTSATIVKRYVKVQKHIEDLNIPKEFQDRPIRELIPIANALSQGYDISQKNWDKLMLARNASDIGHIIREDVKKKPSKKVGLQLVLDRDGSIAVWVKGTTRKHVGYLNVDDADPDVQKAIERITDSASIRRK